MNQTTNSTQQSHEQLAKESKTIYYKAPVMLHPFLHINGKSPSGTMRCNFLPQKDCPGFSKGVISIHYDIPKGTQASYHPNPGVQYDGTSRKAFIPNTPEGHALLTRMRVAFLRGFMFSVGKSLTSGRENQVTWTTVPNKTSLHAGPFGFPDNKYISTANLELDKIGIASANDCLPMAQQCSCDTGRNEGPTYPFQAETITYSAPELSLSKKSSRDLLRPLPSTALSPSVPSAPTVPACTPAPSSTASAAAATFPVSNLQPSKLLLPAKIITVDDLVDTQTCIPQDNSGSRMIGGNIKSEANFGESICTICLTALCNEKAVEITTCHHAFHEACILDAMNHIDKCPVCRKPISGKPQGKSPSGSMTTELMPALCPGFGDGCNTIELTYNIPSGIQRPYHENPNDRYDGTCRIAYVPNNEGGRGLLLRLKYAFRNGLTFRVGTSLTTGQKNQVTWTSIHHKTSLSGGAHGFPDDSYISNCNSSLDALQVPPIDECGS